MSKLLKIAAAWDGSEITIKLASGTVKRFMRRRCWNAACRNPFLYVHTTKNGTATHAYCNPCFRLAQYAKAYNKEKERGNWFFLENGKLVKQKLLPELLPELKIRGRRGKGRGVSDVGLRDVQDVHQRAGDAQAREPPLGQGREGEAASKRKIMISPTVLNRADYKSDVWIKGDYNPHRNIFRLDLNDAIKKTPSGKKVR